MTLAPGPSSPMEADSERREVAFGLALAGARAGAAAGRALLLPGRVALRAPVVGHLMRRAADDLAADGRRVESWARVRIEQSVEMVLAAPEVERSLDRTLAGPLTDAVARSLVQHRVVERVATQVVARADFDRVIDSVLEHEATERIVEQALASPAVERIVVQVLESRLVDELTDRVLESPELDRIVEHVATSPQVVEAISKHTQTLAEDVVTDVRRRTHAADDVAERTVRGWLRRPRPSSS
jgi:hypothetical protein